MITGGDYPTFIIRTFIDNCTNQSLGTITFAGAIFQGRIDCCSTSFCNQICTFEFFLLIYRIILSIILAINIDSKHSSRHIKRIVFILIACLGAMFMLIGISISIYRFIRYKLHNRNDTHIVNNGENIVLVRLH